MKSKLALPVMVALVAVVALALPSAMAESGEYDAKYHKKHHKLVEVTDFVGSIQITEDADRHALKEQVSVTLSEAAANYPDAKKAKLGAVVNENGDKFVVWLVVEAQYDHETHTGTKSIHVIDLIQTLPVSPGPIAQKKCCMSTDFHIVGPIFQKVHHIINPTGILHFQLDVFLSCPAQTQVICRNYIASARIRCNATSCHPS